jgi:Rieske Fe-S protein
VGIGLALAGGRIAAAEDDPTKMPPEPGDQFVFFSGDRKGEVIKLDDLKLGGPQIVAYPIDPKTQTIRSGTRLNTVALVRLEPDKLSDETKKYAANEVVAYSAVCVHQGCPVSMWKSDNSTLFCACHGTEYDPANDGEVMAGPATRRLPILPIKMDGDVVVVNGEFVGKIGFK